MLKRVLLMMAVVAACVASAPTANAETGVGIQFGEPGNVGLSLRFDNIAIGAAWGFGDNGYLHVTADYWLMKNDLAKNLDWFLGLGADLGIGDPFTVAARVPIGLQWMPAKDWEIFGQVAPGLKVIDEVDFYFGGAIGVRYCF
jgi:hypothetical protein